MAGDPALEPAEDDPDEHGEHVAAERGVEGQQIAQQPGQGQYPLSHGNVGNHPIDEMRGQLGHAAAPTRGTEAAPFAAEGHDHLVATVLAAHMQAAVLEEPAPQVGPQLPSHEGRQTSTVVLGGPREKGVEMGLDDPVEDGALRLAALMGRW